MDKNILKISILIYLISFIFFINCTAETFRLTEKSTQIRPGKIVVISGVSINSSYGLATYELVKEITLELEKKCSMNVISQQSIKSIIVDYPFSIVDVGVNTMGKEDSDWMTPEMTDGVNIIAQKLKSDYVLLVWINACNINGFDNLGGLWFDICTRLIEYPSGRVIGYYNYYSDAELSKTQDQEKAALVAIKKGSKQFVQEFIARTKLLKL